jgi:hypothetical protein
VRRASVPPHSIFAGADGGAEVLETGAGGNGWEESVRLRRG